MQVTPLLHAAFKIAHLRFKLRTLPEKPGRGTVSELLILWIITISPYGADGYDR